MFRAILLVSLTNIGGHAMSNDLESLTEDGLETNIDHVLDIFESSSGDIEEGTNPSSVSYTSFVQSSLAYTSFLVYSRNIREKVKLLHESTIRLDSVSDSSGNFLDKDWHDFFSIEGVTPLEIRGIVHSEFRQLPETRWIQNLRHPSYHLHQPIPILVRRENNAATATYDDVELGGTGDNIRAAISDLCTKIVARYEELKESAAKPQEYAFLKRIIEEVESPAWQELKQLYKEKLAGIPYVQEGYIKIEGNNAEVVIVLSEESVDIIMELAQIDLEINQEFRSLSFSVEYESSEDYLELDDFECFY